jgi:hypothetical protein
MSEGIISCQIIDIDNLLHGKRDASFFVFHSHEFDATLCPLIKRELKVEMGCISMFNII